ncbi:MAG: phosphate acyltransferase PlsX [Oscillospiraceae bacterium]|nr:phosphate acyltransferase PlsX [Oscillospiraceae bacterium]
MTIIVDAMGGDNAPDEIVLGAINAAERQNINVTLVGIEDDIRKAMERTGIRKLPENLTIVNASEVIDVKDDPSTAIRTKKDSSLTVGFKLLRDGHGDGLVSAGSTGAILAGATLIVKRIRKVRRAALAPVIPSTTGRFILIDCGANAECTPEYLVQFAYMGAFYARDMLKINSPRIGLLNNGAESTKGTPLQLETYDLLKKTELNFIGNIEAKDAMKGGCDVLVCDGFSGNVMLKSIEGAASLVVSELKTMFFSGVSSKIAALLLKKKMLGLKQKLNPDSTGGTALLGISKPVIKAHGSSNAAAISSAIAQAVREAESDVASKLTDNFNKMPPV